MNRTWLIVIILAVITIGVLCVTWQSIPFLNTFLRDSGIAETLGNKPREIMAGINAADPKTLITALLGMGGVLLTVINKAVKRIGSLRQQSTEIRQNAQAEIGNVKLQFEDAKAQLTGEMDTFQDEYKLLQERYDVDLSKAQDLIENRDGEILKLNQKLNEVQGELNKASTELLITTKEREAFRIQLKDQERVTRN